jgi:cytochrome c oxidase assembly factor CtaG
MLGLVEPTLLAMLGLAALSLLATLRVSSALVLSSLGLCRCLAFALMMVFLVIGNVSGAAKETRVVLDFHTRLDRYRPTEANFRRQ